jgi:hypothetical protein
MSQHNEISNGAPLDKPRVSVVMPTHNRAKELPRSIRSVMSQFFPESRVAGGDEATGFTGTPIQKQPSLKVNALGDLPACNE